ncbi:MAG TPA: hypothetical protein VGK46_15435 [Saprospiraceae bacterium]|jgi:hypothetical protein
MRVLPFFLLIVSLLFSCKPGASSEKDGTSGASQDLQALEKEVMAIHDEVMPKMKDINDLSAKLREIKSRFKEEESGKLNTPAGFEEVQGALKLAEQGMWDWMKSYSDTKVTLQEDQLKPFYEKELEKINKVKEDMLGAIEKAQTWIAAYPK